MTLDLVRLAGQIDALVGALEEEAIRREQRLATAAALLAQLSNADLLAAVAHAEHTIWLLAEPLEPLSTRRGVPPTQTYAALATDGSSIDIDRHGPATCYLVNVGHAWLHYRASEAELGNEPELAFASERLTLADGRNASKESVMTGNLLDAYRTAREMLRLADLAEERSAERPLVAMLDGQFVLWGLKESELSSAAQARIFDEGVFAALDRLRALAGAGRFALGSYISRPGGREVTNSLRIAACPREPHADCQDCPRRPDYSRPCDDVAGGVDRHLFERLLDEGERSAIFCRRSQSSDFVHSDDLYGDRGHAMRFFYLRVAGGEVARVELPEWVAEDAAAVDLLQAAVLDQCARGGGYPVVLQEAHEQAVIDAVDRRSFAALVERELEHRGRLGEHSGKSLSKRRRTI
jgi:hypothetical protein